MTTITITYHVRPYPGHPAVATFKTASEARQRERVLVRYADHVRRQFHASTTRETVWRRLDDGSYEVWRRKVPGGLLLARIEISPDAPAEGRTP